MKNINDILERRLIMDSKLKQDSKLEDDDSYDATKEYILYVDENTVSTEAMEERKKNFSFALHCSIVKVKDMEKIPEWLKEFPYLLHKNSKVGIIGNEAIEKIKSVKLLKQYKKKL